MTAPAATPAIHSPGVIGWNPGTPFVQAIAATGTAPLAYSATGLPTGLSLDASTGIITGLMPAAGSYPVTVTVSNAMGKATSTITLTSGSTMALTPPMGWNSYDSYGGNVTETQYLANAQALKTTLTPFGWNAAVIDYHWYDPEDLTDANGRWLPSPSRFPSSGTGGALGFKAIADQVHALGLLFGIHIMRGIPQSSYKANKPIANSTYTANQAGNPNDTTSWDPTHNYGVYGNTPAGMAWYASIFAQYASWGLDFVKVDDCVDAYHSDEVHAIRAGINMSGRSIVFSLSPGPNPTSSVADLNANANQWRIVNDFWDVNPLTPLYDSSQPTNNVFYFAGQWQAVKGLEPGHWPDADMLPLGQLGSRQTAFTHNQQVTILTLWSILPSPLIYGGETTALASDAWTTALLTNEEVLAIDQDPAGIEATRIAQQGLTEVWARDLSLGRKAVALFNHDTQDAMVSVSFSQLGITSSPVAVRDVWQHMDVTGDTSNISVNVPYQGAVLYVLTPPGAGMVDAGPPVDAATGSSSGAPDASASSASTGSSGASSGSGSVASSGTSSVASSGTSSIASSGSSSGASSDSSSGVSSGGASSSGGVTSTSSGSSPGEDGGATGSGNGASSGCGCRVADAHGPGAPYVPVAFFAIWRARSSRRRRGKPLAIPSL
jgi:hypothetical protein